MKQQLTKTEIEKLQNICFSNPVKACAVAQLLIDSCQVVCCATFSELTGKSKRAINYQADRLIGIEIEGRKFISINQSKILQTN